MKAKFDALQPRARGGADRHADARAAATRSIEQILTQLRVAPDRRGAGRDLHAPGEGGRQGARAARGRGARAKQQTSLTESELSITVQANQGKADYAARAAAGGADPGARGGRGREGPRSSAAARPPRVRALAEAEAERAARVGVAQAIAIEEQVRAYGGPRYQLTQQVMTRFAEAIEKSGVDVVPKVVIGGAGRVATATATGDRRRHGRRTILESLLALLLSERVGVDVAGTRSRARAAARRSEASPRRPRGSCSAGSARATRRPDDRSRHAERLARSPLRPAAVRSGGRLSRRPSRTGAAPPGIAIGEPASSVSAVPSTAKALTFAAPASTT